MFGKYFSRPSGKKFYLPGQEINVYKEFAFRKNYVCEGDPLFVCKNRMTFSVFVFLLAFSAICVRLFNVSVLPNLRKHQETIIATAIESDVVSFDKKPIKRADIVDRNGTIIATSLPTANLFAHPKKISEPNIAAAKLSEVLPDLRYEDILAKLAGKTNFVYIKRNLSPSQQYHINALGIPGLEFEIGEKRVYPHKNLFAHLIGITNVDNAGISGIEKEMDERLTQSDIPLTLSIDIGVQDTIRDILKDAVKKFHALGGSVILMDASNAEILSMVSLPDFDPNTMGKISDQALFNFPTKGVYEPGSVFKIFNTAMGLESGKIKVSDSFDATQPLKLRYNTIKDYRGENRWLSVQEILIHSSNIGSAQIALRVGKKNQQDFMGRLGFLDPLEIELAEKAQPLTPHRWGEETVATVAYGYGISVSPLHVATAFSSIINGGLYRQPTFIKGKNKTTEVNRVISTSTSKSMRKLLRTVVVEGSGKKANIPGFEVLGKTGTANKLSANGRYVDKKVFATFVSAFPASSPKYTLLVMLDEPKATEETFGFVTSGWNSVPTSGKIIEAIAPQLNLKANYDLDELRKNRIFEASFRD